MKHLIGNFGGKELFLECEEYKNGICSPEMTGYCQKGYTHCCCHCQDHFMCFTSKIFGCFDADIAMQPILDPDYIFQWANHNREDACPINGFIKRKLDDNN